MSSGRIGHLLIQGFSGLRVPDELFAFAQRFGLGGIILFSGNCQDSEQVHSCLIEFRRRLLEVDPESPALVMIDQEGGRVERLRKGVPQLPPASVWADRGDEALRSAVSAQAAALAKIGVRVNLAPVCDVRQIGESGVIGDRAFGEDAEAVAKLVVVHVTACLANGLIPCAKHFPGHGAASVDSHKSLPTLDRSLEEMRGLDLVPFRAAVGGGVPLVMAGHIQVPAVSAKPASLCDIWLQNVLRREMGFDGVVISDDMEMGALASCGSPPETARKALEAGCDLLIYGRQLRPEFDVEEVVADLGIRLAPSRVAQALERLRRLEEVCA